MVMPVSIVAMNIVMMNCLRRTYCLSSHGNTIFLSCYLILIANDLLAAVVSAFVESAGAVAGAGAAGAGFSCF
ncbi:hypothetical protein D3C78_1764330 [compost metagenome]